MSAISDLMAADMAALIHPDVMPETESVVWTDAAGVATTIEASVQRGAPLQTETGKTIVNVRLVVARSVVPTVERGRTRFAVAPIKGEPVASLVVAEIERHDAGSWQLRLQ